MLTKWSESEKEEATRDEISYVLEGLKLKEVLEGVFWNKYDLRRVKIEKIFMEFMNQKSSKLDQ